MNEVRRDLEQWLQRLEQLHPSEIDLGLERIRKVAAQAGLLTGFPPIVTVAGTNGKGSVVEYLMQCFEAAGLKTGAYTSPHLKRFNERIRVSAQQVSDDTLTASFEAVEKARLATLNSEGEAVTLTYFEFSTLAAMQIFYASELDVIVLEVGLGGRLDAVNLWDTSCAVITSIDIDHEDWLGSDRETIAAEKVAVARSGCPLIIGERKRPAALEQYAQANDIPCYRLGEEFDVFDIGLVNYSGAAGFRWCLQQTEIRLPMPGLNGPHQIDNAAVAVCALRILAQSSVLPEIPDAVIATGLQRARLAGRMQEVNVAGRTMVLDVAHNAAAAAVLAESLRSFRPGSSCIAVFAIMRDKDIEAVLGHLSPFVKYWHCATLDLPRALPAADAAAMIKLHYPQAKVSEFVDVPDAVQNALALRDSPGGTDEQPYVLVFGSFFTVSDALAAIAD